MYIARIRSENVAVGNRINGQKVHQVLPVGPEGSITFVTRDPHGKGWKLVETKAGQFVKVKRNIPRV